MKAQVELTLSPSDLAAAFAELGSEAQAEFFERLEVIASKWPMGGTMQWFYVGRQMRDRGMFMAESLLKDILGGFEAGGVVERIEKGEPTGGVWVALDEQEREVVRDFAIELSKGGRP